MLKTGETVVCPLFNLSSTSVTFDLERVGGRIGRQIDFLDAFDAAVFFDATGTAVADGGGGAACAAVSCANCYGQRRKQWEFLCRNKSTHKGV